MSPSNDNVLQEKELIATALEIGWCKAKADGESLVEPGKIRNTLYVVVFNRDIGTARVTALTVRENYRRKGIAEFTLRRLVGIMGEGVVWVATDDTNTAMVALLSKLEFHCRAGIPGGLRYWTSRPVP